MTALFNTSSLHRVLVGAALALTPAWMGAQTFSAMLPPSPSEAAALSSSMDGASAAPEGASGLLKAPPAAGRDRSHDGPRGRIGIAGRVGTSGGGLDFGVPLSRHFGVRVGGDFIRYTNTFHEDAANIDAFLQFGYGRGVLDYFPRGGRFHISPLVVFANNTRVQADVKIDPSQQFDLDGQQFRSAPTDPLHGAARIDLRHTAPGLSVGFGNLTRGHGHFTFPTEIGFFYVGQPKLAVNFSGTACDVSQPIIVGCQRVEDNPDFQKSLNHFIARNNHNLSYAQFIPIVNFGIGYRFGANTSGRK